MTVVSDTFKTITMAAVSTTETRIAEIKEKSPEIIDVNPSDEPSFGEIPIAPKFTKAGHWELITDGSGGKSKHTIKYVSNGTCDTRSQFVYMMVVDGAVAKIGGSKNTVKSRVQSYNCGVYSRWRGGSGKQSVTNSVIYDSIEMCLLKGYTVELYVYFIDIPSITLNCWDTHTHVIDPTVYDVYETSAIRMFRELYGKNPIWSKNGHK